MLKSVKPTLSIIVVVYNMQREAPKTLYSLSPLYQKRVNESDYEVIVIENGSTSPLNPQNVTGGFGPNFRYFSIEDASPSPAAAINFGVSRCSADNVGIMIDGARIASPGVVHEALKCLMAFPRAIVSTIGFHLGPDFQPRAILNGYNKNVEDQLLSNIKWTSNGYKLFEISSLAGASFGGWLKPIGESNLLFMPKKLYTELGGYDERFDLPGGGVVNKDFYLRAAALPNSEWILLLGEATFHQIHGGVSTGLTMEKLIEEGKLFRQQFEDIRGYPAPQGTKNSRVPTLFGKIRPEIHSCFRATLNSPRKKT